MRRLDLQQTGSRRSDRYWFVALVIDPSKLQFHLACLEGQIHLPLTTDQIAPQLSASCLIQLSVRVKFSNRSPASGISSTGRFLWISGSGLPQSCCGNGLYSFLRALWPRSSVKMTEYLKLWKLWTCISVSLARQFHCRNLGSNSSIH